MPTPQYHIHQKQRNTEASPSTLQQILDKAIYVVGVFWPMMTLPQLKVIWVDGITEGISLRTRGGYIAFTCVWILYGIVHKEKPIIFTQTLWFIVYSLVVIGTIVES